MKNPSLYVVAARKILDFFPRRYVQGSVRKEVWVTLQILPKSFGRKRLIPVTPDRCRMHGNLIQNVFVPGAARPQHARISN